MTDDEWIDIPDFYYIVREIIFKASMKVLFGPHLFILNPKISAEFWKFDAHKPYLFKSPPRLFIPKS